MSIYSDLREVVNEAAMALKGAGKSQFTTADVADWIRENHSPEWPRFETSFQVNYSTLTRDPECVVERVPGKFLYQVEEEEEIEGTEGLSEAPSEAPREIWEEEGQEAKAPYVHREDKLYAVLRDWLESRGYQSAITANARKGGTWGNPDVTGLRVDELPLGLVSYECSTVEAKLSSDNWRYWLFEAVAHKRFAHRAWFAFAVGTDTPSLDRLKDAEKMCEYAERYRIGVLVAFIAKDQYSQLTQGNPSSLELSQDDVRVEILWPAFYEPVQVPALNEFMTDVLEIHSLNELRQFGA